MKTIFRGLRLLTIILSFVNLHQTVLAQDSKLVDFSPQDGFHVQSQNKKFDLKLGIRLQEQAFATTPVRNGDISTNDMVMRRARFLVRGYAFSDKLSYFVQFDYDKSNYRLSNLEYRWKPTSNLQVNVGQLRPPTGRQFQTISKNFQMVDRSIVSRYFAVGYDQGILVAYKNKLINNSAYKLAGSITHGEGINQSKGPGGLAYSGRIDVLPFGFFHKNGDYVESDLYREPTPKVSLGAAFYFNKDADTQMGMSDLDMMNNSITSFYIDAVFKYKGFSMIGEIINRDITNDGVRITGDDPIRYSSIAGGNGYSLQMGKFLGDHLEPTLRLSILDPDDTMMAPRNLSTFREKYTLGLNYFFIGHTLKVQTEMSFVEEEYHNRAPFDYVEFLMQFSVSF